MNIVKTGMLLAALTALFGVVGYLLGGRTGMMIALGVRACHQPLRLLELGPAGASAHHAVEVDERTAPELVRLVARARPPRRAADAARLLIEKPQPNAFATGRNPEHAAVAATTGLLRHASAATSSPA